MVLHVFANAFLKQSDLSAEAAATELVKLYVQKGHNPIACSRFLKGKSADYGDLCVSPPVPKGSPPHSPSPLFHKQGRQARHIYLTQRSYDVSREALALMYLRSFPQAVHPTFPRFDSWFFHVSYPINGFSHSCLSAAVRRSSAAVASLQMRTNCLLKTPSI